MQFNSFPYLIFLIAAVVVYWMLPVRFRRIFVLAASLAFYATWGFVFVGVPIFVCTLVHLISRQMVAEPARAKRWMWLGIGCVLVILIFFKYRDFTLASVNTLMAWIAAQPITFATAIALPVGISFYTFEAIGYLIDVRQGRITKPAFMDLFLFFMFWPNIMSGPIVRARELVPQLKFDLKFEARFAFEGIDRLIWGLVQKNVIANTLNLWVAKGFASNAGAPSTIDGWFLAVAFGLEIYFDFAGYSNIAIGTARLIGVTLPENFRQPYHAVTPAEFWARWHMSLSRWIRDYLFFPINATYKGAPLPLYVSLLSVMAVVGLWHGAGWNFIVWGVMHGVYLVVFRMYESRRKPGSPLFASRLIAGAWRLLTLIGVTAAWVPFGSPNLQMAAAILSRMFFRFTDGMAYGTAFYAFTVGVTVFCAIEPLLVQRLRDVEAKAGEKGPALTRILGRPLAYTCGLLLFMLFDEHDSQFVYFQF